eukprot:m.481264 g.481264  ORF g.481264 m.481264 type:complete len:223 (-) comp22108_c0_seq1:329-997(-)
MAYGTQHQPLLHHLPLPHIRLPAGRNGAIAGLIVGIVTILSSIGLTMDLAVNASDYVCTTNFRSDCDTNGLYLRGSVGILLFLAGVIFLSALCGLCICSGNVCNPLRILGYTCTFVWLGLATAGFVLACMQQTGSLSHVATGKWRGICYGSSMMAFLSLVVLCVDGVISIRIAGLTGYDEDDTVSIQGDTIEKFNPLTGAPLAEGERFRFNPYTGAPLGSLA